MTYLDYKLGLGDMVALASGKRTRTMEVYAEKSDINGVES